MLSLGPHSFFICHFNTFGTLSFPRRRESSVYFSRCLLASNVYIMGNQICFIIISYSTKHSINVVCPYGNPALKLVSGFMLPFIRVIQTIDSKAIKAGQKACCPRVVWQESSFSDTRE